MNNEVNKDIAYIVYDGECPFCSRYVRLLRLRDSLPNLQLVDARGTHPAVDFVEKRGVVLDNEMALILNGVVYSGHECINRLALLSTRSGAFNRFNALAFRSSAVTRLAYPVMRTVRNATLLVLGRRKIRP